MSSPRALMAVSFGLAAFLGVLLGVLAGQMRSGGASLYLAAHALLFGLWTVVAAREAFRPPATNGCRACGHESWSERFCTWCGALPRPGRGPAAA